MKSNKKSPPVSDIPSDLAILEEILSGLQGIKEDLDIKQDLDFDLKEIEELESKTVRLIKELKNPKLLIHDHFKKRIEEFYKPIGELTSDHFDFLWTYLLCCFFSIKYKDDFGCSFPPDDEDYNTFARFITKSYNSKAIKGIKEILRYYILREDYPIREEFFKDADRRFNNIGIEEKNSFIRLSYHCRYMFLLKFYLSQMIDAESKKGHPLKRHIDKIKKKNIEVKDFKKVIDGWAIDLFCRIQNLIGYWEAEYPKEMHETIRKDSSKEVLEQRTKARKQIVIEAFFMIKGIKKGIRIHTAAIEIRCKLLINKYGSIIDKITPKLGPKQKAKRIEGMIEEGKLEKIKGFSLTSIKKHLREDENTKKYFE